SVSLHPLFSPVRPLRRPTHFPYTTLFRSEPSGPRRHAGERLMGPLHEEGLERSGCLPEGEGDHVCGVPVRRVLQSTIPMCPLGRDRKSTRLNSSHVKISYAVFCLKKKEEH